MKKIIDFIKNKPKAFVKYLIYVIIFLTLNQYGIYFLHKNRMLNLIDDALVIFLLLFIVYLAIKKTIAINPSKYDIFFFCFFAVSVISSILNKVPLLNFLLGMKGYFLYIFLFYVVYWINFNKQEISDIIGFIIKIFYLQLLICVFQLVFSILNKTLGPDSLKGAFSGANFLGYTVFLPLYFCLYDYCFNHNKKQVFNVIVLSCIMIISSARFGLLLFPILFLSLNLGKLSKKTLIKIGFGFLILLGFIMLIGPTFVGGGRSIFSFFNPDTLIYQFTIAENNVSGGSGRNLWYSLTKKNLEEQAKNPYIGFGVGEYASFAAFTLMPPTNYLIYNYFNQSSIGVDLNVDSQIIPIWGELGHIGIALAYLMLFAIAIRMFYLRKSDDMQQNALSHSTHAYTWFFIVGYYFNHMLEAQTTALLFFLFLAVTETYAITKEGKNGKKSL